MSLINTWADACTGISFSGGVVKLHLGVVEIAQIPLSQESDPEKGQRMRLTETVALPLAGFAHMIGIIDEVRERPEIKEYLQRVDEGKQKLRQAVGE